MRHRWFAHVVIAVVGCQLVGQGSALGDEREVTVVTPMLDAADSGQAIGIPLVVSTVTGQAVSQLPSVIASSPAANAVLTGANQVAAEIVTRNRQGIQLLRQLTAPLASQNDAMNRGIDAMVSAMRQGGETLHPAIQPADELIYEVIPTMEQMKRPAP